MKKIELHLSIAEVKIKLEFDLVEEKIRILNQFIKAIQLRYKNYIIKPTKHIDHIIRIVYTDSLPKIYINQPTRTFFIEYFQEYATNITKTYYHISISELNLLILNILDKYLSSNDGFILHASALEHNNYAYIFLAPSGGGKSTITKIANKNIRKIADDYIAIKKLNNEYRAFHLADVDFVTLRYRQRILFQSSFAIQDLFFLIKDRKWVLKSINKTEDITQLFLNQIISNSIYRKSSIINALNFIKSRNNYYNLHFPKSGKGSSFIKLFNIE